MEKFRTAASAKHQRTRSKIRRTPSEILFDTLNVIFMVLLGIVTIYPFWYIVVMSLNTGADAATGPVWLWPRAFTLENYAFVLSYKRLQYAFLVTILRCLTGPIISVLICMLAAFSLSKRFLPARKFILFFFMLPMFIGGSLISNYIVMVKLGLINNFLVYILPGAFGFFTMVIMRTHIENLPIELQESAMIDGAGYVRILFQIIFPLCMPVVAAFLFFSVVGNWLDYATTLYYVTDRNLSTVQYVMYEIIQRSEATALIDFSKSASVNKMQMSSVVGRNTPTPEVIKMTVMAVVTLPILFVYPFFQKYFASGMLTGAIKA